MKLILDRFEFTETSTIGTLMCGDFSCYTLEDADRHLEDNPEKKVYGRTAIPRGTYQVVITHSNRFKQELPLVKDVPGFEGIRIHAGNSPEDTHGCILVGSTHSKDFVGNSRATMLKLSELIQHALDLGDAVELEIL